MQFCLFFSQSQGSLRKVRSRRRRWHASVSFQSKTKDCHDLRHVSSYFAFSVYSGLYPMSLFSCPKMCTPTKLSVHCSQSSDCPYPLPPLPQTYVYYTYST
eukprot:2303452-Pleurochrysis_carterae.AAC.1